MPLPVGKASKQYNNSYYVRHGTRTSHFFFLFSSSIIDLLFSYIDSSRHGTEIEIVQSILTTQKHFLY